MAMDAAQFGRYRLQGLPGQLAALSQRMFGKMQQICNGEITRERHNTTILQDVQDLQRDRLMYLVSCRASLEWAESNILSVRSLISKERLSNDIILQNRLQHLLRSPKFLLAGGVPICCDQLCWQSTSVGVRASDAYRQSREARSMASAHEELFNTAIRLRLGPFQAAHALIRGWVVAGLITTISDDDMKHSTECDLLSAANNLERSKADFESDIASLAAAQSACAEARKELLRIRSSKGHCHIAAHTDKPIDGALVSDNSAPVPDDSASVSDIGSPVSDDSTPVKDEQWSFGSVVQCELKNQLPNLEQLGNLLHAAIADIDQAILICEGHLKL